MSDATPHRATPFHWSEMDRTNFNSAPSCILELRARIEALESGATCPHVATSDEGTSYCRLAEQQATESAPAKPLVVPPLNCRQRLIHEGNPYPKSSCEACGSMSPKWRQCEAAMKAMAAAPPKPAPAGSLVDRVDQAIAIACDDASAPHWAPEACAAIRAVAEWLRGQRELGAQTWAWHLEQEAER